MGQHRQAVGAGDEAHSIFRGKPVARDIGIAVCADIFVESLADGLDIASFQKGLGNVRPAYRSLRYLAHAVPGDIDALKFRARIFNEISEHMYFSAADIGIDFDAGDKVYIQRTSRL